jgi:hypothetical protein
MKLEPNSIEDAIALAQSALQFDKIDLAEMTLKKLGSAAERFPTYHEAEAQLAIAKKDPGSAERQFAAALKLDPSNKLYQLNVAVFQLQSKSPEIRARASKLLQGLMKDKALRVPAARAMRDYAAQRKDVPALTEITALLYSWPEATFRDRISFVQVLHALNAPAFAARLSELQGEAAKDPAKLTDLLTWMNANRLSLFAIDWVKRLPAEITNKRPVPVAVADCYIAARDWDGLQQWCKKNSWGDLDFLRHVYLARASRERGDDLGFKAEWNAAVAGAGSDAARIYALEQDTAKWGWKNEAEGLLWALTKDPNKESFALAGLNQYYLEKGDSEDLYRVVARLCEIRPDDQEAQNNLAQLSLLLNLNVEHARALARQLHSQNPKNAVFASTYAFSLYRQGHYQQAVNVMSDLPADKLRQPAIAAYYGVFLAAAGDARAREFLDLGRQARLLPEEKALVEKAGTTIKSK